jgi:GH18 family chitinase
VARSATARQNFADEALRLCQVHGLTGIDIDWEFPAAGQETDFRMYLKTLYETLHPAGYKVSAACGGEDLHAVKWTGDIFNYIDDLNIMSYDAPTSVSSNHASLQFMKDAMDIYHARGCPYEKMLGGLAFYSRPSVKMYSDVINQSLNKQSTFESDGTGSVKYNGKNTIEDKIDYVMSKGGLGVLIWEVTQDIKGNYSLLNVCDETMENYRCPLPKPDLGSDVSICGIPSVALDANVSGNFSYSWKKNGTPTGGNTKLLNATSAGTYTVTISDGACDWSDEIEVLGTLPSIDLGSNLTLCV